MSKKIFVCAAEVSGDRHAANLIRSIKEKEKNIEVFGVGGHFLENEGVEILSYTSDKGVFGFVEVLQFIPDYIKLLRLITIKP